MRRLLPAYICDKCGVQAFELVEGELPAGWVLGPGSHWDGKKGVIGQTHACSDYCRAGLLFAHPD